MFNVLFITIVKKETWKLIIQIAINVLTAIATAIGVTSCFAA